MAAIKLVTGWMAIATLGITRLSLKEADESSEQFWPQGRFFRLFAAGIVTVIVTTAAPRVEEIIPGIGLPVITGKLDPVRIGHAAPGHDGPTVSRHPWTIDYPIRF